MNDKKAAMRLIIAMRKALQAALVNITTTANITCGHYDRKLKRYVFDDKIWKEKSPGSFEVAQKVRRAIAAAQANARDQRKHERA